MYSLNYKVTTSTCDEQGKLKLFAALQMMQDCSELWFSSELFLKKFFDENDRAQLLAFRQVEIVRKPDFGEDLTVQTSVYEVQPRFGFRNTFIYDAEGMVCLRSWSMGAFVNRSSGTLSPIPDSAYQDMKMEEKLPMNYLPRKIVVPKSAPRICAPFPIMKDYIDYNKHVNNAQYIRLALELLPDNFEVANLRVEFKAPARLGDVLVPHVYQESDVIIVVLYHGDSISAVVEFSR